MPSKLGGKGRPRLFNCSAHLLVGDCAPRPALCLLRDGGVVSQILHARCFAMHTQR